MALQIPAVKDQSVVIEVRDEKGTPMPVVVFTGLLTARDPGPLLSPFFEKLHQAMLVDGRKSVEVDLCALRFMNSSSFKHFVSWIRMNGASPSGKRYQIHFLLNPAHHWQTASIDALSCFAEGLIESRLLGAGAARAG